MDNPLEQVVKLLKAENSNYKLNFEKIKRAYSEQQQTIESLAAQVQILKSEKENLSGEHARLVNEWKTKLAKQTKEFDDMRRKLVPVKDVNVIKTEAFVEYQETLKSRDDLHQVELEKWRNLYFTIQKDFEIFKIGLEEKESFYQAALQDMESMYQQEITQLHLKINEKNEALDDTASIGQRLRELQRQNNELTLKVKALTTDHEHLQTQMTDDRANYQLTIQNSNRQLIEKESELNNMKAERDVGRKKETQLEEELRKGNLFQDELQKEISKLRLEIHSWKTKYDEMVHEFKMEKNDANYAFVKERTLFEQKLKQLESIVAERDSTIRASKQEINDVEEQKRQLQQNHIQSTIALKESHGNEERVLREKIMDMEKIVATLQQAKHSESKEFMSRLEIAHQSNQSLEATISSLRLQMQNLVSTKDEIEAELQITREKFESTSRRLVSSEELSSRQMAELNELKRKEQEHLIKVCNLEEANIGLQRELSDVQDSFQRQIKRLSETEAELCNKIDSKMRENTDLNNQIKKVNEESQSQINNLVDAMKKLKQGYKKRVEEMEEKLSDLQEENEALRKSLENENHESQLRLKEMYRRQQEFAQFLQSEGLFSSK